MDKQLFAAFILLGVSPFCSAKLDCEAIAGIAAGEANYLYESAKVKTDSRLHFYSAPATECQLPAFMVNGDTVEVLRSSQRYKSTGMLSKDEPYRYVRYRDAKGTFATGWVSADGLTLLSSPLAASASCQSWANKEMSQRGYLPYSFANHYQVMGDARAWFYAMPTEQCRSPSVFLVPGDLVSVQEQSNDDFMEAVYYTTDRQIIRGWLKKSQLQAINSGDHYRDDINPLRQRESPPLGYVTTINVSFMKAGMLKRPLRLSCARIIKPHCAVEGPTHKRHLPWLISVSTRPAVKFAGQMLPKDLLRNKGETCSNRTSRSPALCMQKINS